MTVVCFSIKQTDQIATMESSEGTEVPPIEVPVDPSTSTRRDTDAFAQDKWPKPITKVPSGVAKLSRPLQTSFTA